MLNRKPPPDPDATGLMVLTAGDLRARGSCDPFYQLYLRLFPNGQVPTEAACRRHAHRFEWGWARQHLLTHAERERFNRESLEPGHRALDEPPTPATAAEVEVATERHRQALIHAREVLVARLVEHERGAAPTAEPPFRHLTAYTQDLRAATAAYRLVTQAAEVARLDQREADARLFARIWADRPPSGLTAAEYVLADEERRRAERRRQWEATQATATAVGWGRRPPVVNTTAPLRWEVANHERVQRLLQELNELERGAGHARRRR